LDIDAQVLLTSQQCILRSASSHRSVNPVSASALQCWLCTFHRLASPLIKPPPPALHAPESASIWHSSQAVNDGLYPLCGMHSCKHQPKSDAPCGRGGGTLRPKSLWWPPLPSAAPVSMLQPCQVKVWSTLLERGNQAHAKGTRTEQQPGEKVWVQTTQQLA
jgi:hypothetical protein